MGIRSDIEVPEGSNQCLTYSLVPAGSIGKERSLNTVNKFMLNAEHKIRQEFKEAVFDKI